MQVTISIPLSFHLFCVFSIAQNWWFIESKIRSKGFVTYSKTNTLLLLIAIPLQYVNGLNFITYCSIKLAIDDEERIGSGKITSVKRKLQSHFSCSFVPS